MNVLAIAFAIAWVAVALYVGWIGRQQRLLAARLRNLADLTEKSRGDRLSAAKAA